MQIEKLTLGSLSTNCYIVYDNDTKKAFVIDPADNFIIIKDKIETLCVNVEYIILTHAHIDHITALDELKEYTKAKLVVHKYEKDLLSNKINNLAQNFGAVSPISEPDILVEDGDTLNIGNSTIKFIHTPGHTKGGMCILANDDLFSGDTLFYMSVGRSDFYGGNFEEEISSIKNKLLPLGDNIKVHPGHGDSTTISFERQNNMFLM